jgi:hypothetical protein
VVAKRLRLLPVLQSTKFEFVINLQTHKADICPTQGKLIEPSPSLPAVAFFQGSISPTTVRVAGSTSKILLLAFR